MKKEKQEVKLTSKGVASELRRVLVESQTLTQVVKIFDAQNAEGKKVMQSVTTFGITVKEMLGLMGLNLEKGKLTVGAVKFFWQIKLGGQFAQYANRPVTTKAGDRVYVANKDGKLVPLSVYALAAVERTGYTPAVLIKGLEQNWLPATEAKKAAAKLEQAKNVPAYYIKGLEDFEQVEPAEIDWAEVSQQPDKVENKKVEEK